LSISKHKGQDVFGSFHRAYCAEWPHIYPANWSFYQQRVRQVEYWGVDRVYQPYVSRKSFSLSLSLSLSLDSNTKNPSDAKPIAKVYAASADDVDAAVKAARKAFKDPSWRDISGTERGALLYKLAELVETHAETLATIETWDNGKPYSVALNEDIGEVAAVIKYYAGWADKQSGQVIDVGANKLAYTIKEPLGVCGQIIPWNYPLGMAAWKLGPALATGNAVVLKAAEQTPLSILYLATLIKEAGFPPGIVNILNGYGREAGKALASHLDVDKIAFTGSTATGKEIMKMAAINIKNITLETGGKSALVIFDDAELDQAVKWAVSFPLFPIQTSHQRSSAQVLDTKQLSCSSGRSFSKCTINCHVLSNDQWLT
jgi:acyl-CoA reductase-like NAD-dependent aldehyde dehydrogenase